VAFAIALAAAAMGCRDDVQQASNVAPAFTGVPRAAPHASGARLTTRSGPPPFRSVYNPGNGGPPVVLPPGHQPPLAPPGDPRLEEPFLDDPDLPPDPFDDEPKPPDPPLDDELQPPPKGLGL